MEHAISPMQLLVSIVERGKGISIMEYYKKHSLFHHIQASGHGTAASHLLDTFGFGTSERDIVLTFGPRDTVRELILELKDDKRPRQNIQGIVFSLNMSGMSSVLAVCLSQTERPDTERSKQAMEQTDHYSLIIVTVNRGYTDAVMDTAKAAGAWGGTVVRARWIGADEIQKVTGITMQSEKELLAIVAHNEERNTIMEEIDRAHGPGSAAQAMLISLPIEHTARLF